MRAVLFDKACEKDEKENGGEKRRTMTRKGIGIKSKETKTSRLKENKSEMVRWKKVETRRTRLSER